MGRVRVLRVSLVGKEEEGTELTGDARLRVVFTDGRAQVGEPVGNAVHVEATPVEPDGAAAQLEVDGNRKRDLIEGGKTSTPKGVERFNLPVPRGQPVPELREGKLADRLGIPLVLPTPPHRLVVQRIEVLSQTRPSQGRRHRGEESVPPLPHGRVVDIVSAADVGALESVRVPAPSPSGAAGHENIPDAAGPLGFRNPLLEAVHSVLRHPQVLVEAIQVQGDGRAMAPVGAEVCLVLRHEDVTAQENGAVPSIV